MKRIKTLTAMAAVALLCALPAQANLVINGGFETGSLAPDWDSLGDGASIAGVADAHSGSFAVRLSPVDSGLRQTVPIVGGSTYVLDFWAKSSGAGSLSAFLDGVTGSPAITFALATAYAHYSYTLTPATSGSVRFAWSDGDFNSAFIDDISLVPEPTTIISGAMLLLPFAASTLRVMRKKRTA